jgi:hypothetical protein
MTSSAFCIKERMCCSPILDRSPLVQGQALCGWDWWKQNYNRMEPCSLWPLKHLDFGVIRIRGRTVESSLEQGLVCGVMDLLSWI